MRFFKVQRVMVETVNGVVEARCSERTMDGIFCTIDGQKLYVPEKNIVQWLAPAKGAR